MNQSISNRIIRPASAHDVDILCEYNRRMAKETENKDLDPEALRAGVSAMLADPNKGRYFVAEEGGEVVGQLAVTREWSDWRNGQLWWIQSVYVVTHARRQGVFRQLFEQVLKAAGAESDVIGVRLYVEHDNRVAQQTYRQVGLEMTGYQVMQKYPLR